MPVRWRFTGTHRLALFVAVAVVGTPALLATQSEQVLLEPEKFQHHVVPAASLEPYAPILPRSGWTVSAGADRTVDAAADGRADTAWRVAGEVRSVTIDM